MASLLNDLPGTAGDLARHMGRISEDVYSAGWHSNLEWMLWDALTIWRQTGRDNFPDSYGTDLAVWMWELDWLQKRAVGWVWWLGGEQFVSEGRWLRLVEARPYRPFDSYPNAQLDTAVVR
ncbi:hypothetical protein [Verrucosispora sp. NA02020]|uniref:hypothetical protein n=1 Tax=Verrucosispora sp. NA02020 TaxID=2742132 RepID=UPI001591B23E|nr:hypothetical protein [Verrucosispora sp. NA02020]QKW15332.1 hypothetical protein HUT12_22935 [Verrucosispora sp. NA02020]